MAQYNVEVILGPVAARSIGETPAVDATKICPLPYVTASTFNLPQSDKSDQNTQDNVPENLGKCLHRPRKYATSTTRVKIAAPNTEGISVILHLSLRPARKRYAAICSSPICETVKRAQGSAVLPCKSVRICRFIVGARSRLYAESPLPHQRDWRP